MKTIFKFPVGLLVALVLPALLTACGGEQVELILCEDSIDPTSPVLNNGFGFNLHNTRNQQSPINASNVANLKLDFTLNAEDVKERRGAPAVTQQTIYYHTPNSVEAVNRETGCIYWSHESSDRIRSASVTLVDEPTLGKRLVVVGTWMGWVLALDAETGEQIWRANAKAFGSDMITGGMQYHNGQLYVPLATKSVVFSVVQFLCCSSHGSLVALNTADGSEQWRFHTTEDASRIDLTSMGPNGVSIWSTPLLDTARNQVLVGTSQNLTQPTTHMENSVVAINMDNGEVNWVFQATANDAYNVTCDTTGELVNHCDGPVFDWDVITPILTQNSQGQDIIIAGDKKGSVYQLDPSTGNKNWETRLGAGGTLGGIHWGMAVDDTQVYASIADATAAKFSIFKSALSADAVNFTGLNFPMLQVPNAMPGIYALDKDTGALNWEIHHTHYHEDERVDSLYSAALSVTNDVLFAASLDGVINAIRTSTGETLWSFDTAISITDMHGRSGHGGTVESVGPVIAGDTVLLNSGYNTFGGTNEFQAGPGNALFVFKLEQDD